MQPKIIGKKELMITGLTGDGAKTEAVWNEFECLYKAHPFLKTSEDGYEIRFFNGEKPITPGEDIHVGFLGSNGQTDPFTSIVLPATEYAVFDVHVTKGYDSNNHVIDIWLEENKAQFGQRWLEGTHYIVECYNEKFQGGIKPESVVELWVPVFRFCQSCGMPLTNPGDFATEAKGSINQEYCRHCYDNGKFLYDQTMEEMIESCIPFCREFYESDQAARADMQNLFPKLKRWAKK